MGQKQEQEEKQKKKIERYNVLRKGKVIFWNVSESEMFDIMEDLAVECYYNKTLTSKDITYEPYIEEPLNGLERTGMMGALYVLRQDPKNSSRAGKTLEILGNLP